MSLEEPLKRVCVIENKKCSCVLYQHEQLNGTIQFDAGLCYCNCVGLARTIYIRCIYGNYGRKVTKYTVIHGVYVRFWPTLQLCVPVI